MHQGRVKKVTDPSGKSPRRTALVNPTYDRHHLDVIGGGASAPQSYINRHDDSELYENWQLPANKEDSGVYVNLKPPTEKSICNNNLPGALVSDSFDTDDAYKLLRKQSSALVNQDKDVFVRTRAYQRSEDLLKGNRILLLRGTPASGKSALGLSLLRHFAVSGFAPLVLLSCLEWRNHIRRNRKQSVLLDCVLGEVRVERARYEEWLPLFSQLRSVARDNPNCLLVITLHSHVMAQFDSMTKNQSYFRNIPLMDLDDLPLDLEEKEAILTKHMATRKINLNAKVTRDIVHRDRCGPLFPLCCASFVRDFSRDQYVNLRYDHEVFTSPGLAYLKFFTAVLKDPESWTDLVPLLILAMNRSGFVLGQEENLEAKLRMLGLVTIDVNLEGIKTWAVLLKGSVLSSDMKQFRNSDLGDGFSFALFKNHSAEVFLNACDVQFLVNHVHVEPTSRRSDIVIDSASLFFPKLQERVCKEILNDNIVQVSQHPALQNSKFLEEFEAFLYRQQCFRAVMSAQDSRHKLPLLYWSAWSGSGVLTCWCLRKILSEDAGRVVRQTFLACSLSGEKVDTPRMTRMFQWLCAPENKAILNDAISAVALPMPAAEDRLCKEVRARVQEMLDGPTVFTCGLPKNPAIYFQPGDSTIIAGLLPQRRDDTIHAVSSQRLTEVPPLMSFAGSSGDISKETTLPPPPPPPPRPPPPILFAFPQHSDVGSFVSDSLSSSSGSGSYISFKPAPFHQALDMMQGRALSIIVENDTEEGAKASRDRSAGAGGLERGQRGGSYSIVLSDKSGTVTSTAQLQSGKPVPPSIVKLSVDKEEGKVVLEPFCVRWYTFLRLVSLCEVDEQNMEGYTLLHIAAYQGELNVVRFLVDTGADLAVLTQKGNTALTKAVDLNRVDVAAFLLEEGSKAVLVSSTNPVEEAVLSTAENNGGPWDLSWMLGTREPFDIFSKVVQKRRAHLLRLLYNYDIRPKQEAEVEGLLKEAASVQDNHAVVRLLTDFRQYHGRRAEMIRNAAGQGGGGVVADGRVQVRSERPASTSAEAAQKPASKKGFKGLKRILKL